LARLCPARPSPTGISSCSDPFEGSIAASALGQHVIATGLADAIEQYSASLPAGGPGGGHHPDDHRF
jgi:hypothetical protein